jgi:hypothetical protein
MSSSASRAVARRRVFYIPGYDPFPPRRYRELYRKESVQQSEISGYEIAILPGLSEGDGFGWRVQAQMSERSVETDIEVLVWSDIVRKSRPETVLATYRELFRTAWIYMSTGALFRLMRLRKGPVIAALYPVVALLLQAALAAGLALAVYRVVSLMVTELGAAAVGGLSVIAGLICGVFVFGLTLRWFRENDGKFFAYYLMHDFAYSASERGRYPLALEDRLVDFRNRINKALDSDVDEVLVVGHSSGAHLAVSVLSDLLGAGFSPADRPVLALLTLGHVVPMISFLPEAGRLRRDLHFLSQSHDLIWVDVSAPSDGGCFALCDPVAVSGLATEEKRGPLVISAAYKNTLSRARMKALRWRFFRLHFQYLCAFDQPGDYDYFRITAGPMLLADRYRGRAPSPSRIERPVNRHRAMAR